VTVHSRKEMVIPLRALKGRAEAIVVERPHLTFGGSLVEAAPDGAQTAYVAWGCFWGPERKFFELNGVVSTAVDYQGGYNPNPTFQEAFSGMTGHTESVKVIFDPATLTYDEVLRCFYEIHGPTQGNRPGGDVGTQYCSAVDFVDERQEHVAGEVTVTFAERLRAARYGPITTEIASAAPFYLAEEYHQQYLVANPKGYCGIGGTGVSCPIGLAKN
jgi:peptide-methionine (S)-S-oxide reductase